MLGDAGTAGAQETDKGVAKKSMKQLKMEQDMCELYRKIDAGKDIDTPERRHDFLKFIAENGNISMRDLCIKNASSPITVLSPSSSAVEIASAAYFAAYGVVLSETTEADLACTAAEFFNQPRTLSGSLYKMDMCAAAYFNAMQDESRPSAAKSSAGTARPAFDKTVSASERRPKHPFLSRDTDDDLRDVVLESRAPGRLRFMLWDKDGLYSGMFATMSSHKKYTSGTKWVVFLDVLGRKIAVEKASLIAVPNVCDTSVRVCGFCAVQVSNDSESLDTPGAGWCGTCKNTFYCCRQHQKDHLHQHRYSCKVTQTLGHDYNVTKFECPEIDTVINTSPGPLAQDSSELDMVMKVRAQGMRSLLKLLTASVSQQASIAASTSPDDIAEYRGLACMQICLTYHKMAVCCLCLGHCDQAHKMMDRAQDYYNKPDRVNLSPPFQQTQFTAGWIHLERDVLIQASSYIRTPHTSTLPCFGVYVCSLLRALLFSPLLCLQLTHTHTGGKHTHTHSNTRAR